MLTTEAERLSGLEKRLSMKEMAIVTLISQNNHITLKELAARPGMSKSTIDRIIKSLKEKGIVQRIGAKNKSVWHIIFP